MASIKEQYLQWYQDKQRSLRLPLWNNPNGIAERAERDGIKPDYFLGFTAKVAEECPGAVAVDPASGKTAIERLQLINDEKPAPEPLIRVKPAPVHPHTGRSFYDLKAKQEAEAAAKADERRKARNPWRASHVLAPEDDE